MAVPEQTPYIEHTGNGVTKSFALGFICESKGHLIVLVDEIEPPIATWSLSGGNVVFTTAPASGKKITLQRNTPFGRTTEYQSFNNSFRPQSVNGDFDRLWLKLQELGIADWLMKLYVDRLHQQQEVKIKDLKAYVDDRDDELRSYLMEEIRKQGVALDQLDEYYNYLMQRLAQIAVDKGWDASFVVDGDKTQKQINDEQKQVNAIQKRKILHVLDFGLRMDGSDETAELNEIIADLDNCRLIIGGGNITLSKTALYAADYPKNDQPCVPILDKTNFIIEIASDCMVHVPAHGQTPFEMMRCTGSWVIVNGAIKGAGNFPPLDGNTGLAEKGTSTAGYQTEPGFYKNNSLNTSSYSTGGYGGAFPQWGGGTASTWGVWNGGYIGNEGYGVLIHNNCFVCGVTGLGEIYGFNGSGVQIGFNGSYSAPSLNYPPSKYCIVKGVRVHDCYTNGISNSNSIGSIIEDNEVYKIGHPNASIENDQFYDPGYGIVTPFSIGSNAVDAVWKNNKVRDCVRKGVDLHSGVNTTISGNTITDCWVAGAFVAQADVAGIHTKDNKVLNNTFIRCGIAANHNLYQGLGGVQLYSINAGRKLNTLVQGNTFIDCTSARGVINIDGGDGNIVKENTIYNINFSGTHNFWCISAGEFSASHIVNDTVIQDNYLVTGGYVKKGITTRYGSGLIKDNVIKMNTGSIVGFDHLDVNSAWDYIGNHVNTVSGSAYNIKDTKGVSLRNTETLSGAGVVGDKATSRASDPLFASVIVTFNNTETPSFTVLKGSDVIDTVINDPFGFRVNLKNLSSTQKVFAAVVRTDAEGLVTATGNANYIYTRAATYQTVVIGLQLTPASTAIEAQNVTRNSVRVDIFITN